MEYFYWTIKPPKQGVLFHMTQFFAQLSESIHLEKGGTRVTVLRNVSQIINVSSVDKFFLKHSI